MPLRHSLAISLHRQSHTVQALLKIKPWTARQFSQIVATPLLPYSAKLQLEHFEQTQTWLG
jgi:hypothetical protein